MAKRKHNIAYIKPEEPKFLRELKAQAGYKEGPTVDTKREALPGDDDDDDEDRDDRDEEEPTVVVLKDGDLTAEQADAIRKQNEEEEANTKADLTKRVIFKKNKTSETLTNVEQDPVIKKSKKSKTKKVPLSFNDEDDE